MQYVKEWYIVREGFGSSRLANSVNWKLFLFVLKRYKVEKNYLNKMGKCRWVEWVVDKNENLDGNNYNFLVKLF